MSPTHYQQEALSDYLSGAEQGSVWICHPLAFSTLGLP